ncbi:hypothetical protein BGX27_003853 [Mortierella sp. AM989]|nr:hypothetical protein BGX27_003853 [Mortierella sp. AM989]
MLFARIVSLTLLAASTLAVAPQGAAFDHVFIVFLENTDYALTYSNPSFQALAAKGILLDNYHGVTHPSQGNYVATISGALNGVTGDGTYKFSSTYKTVVDLLEARELTWKAYQENMPSVCYTRSSHKHLYYRKHNPFISFNSISKNTNRCKNVVPATQFSTDLKNGILPNYMFYTPNIKNDGHDTTVKYAGEWLTGFLNPLLQNPSFLNRTLVVVTFDEADDYTDEYNHILGLLLGDAVNGLANTVDSTFYTHYSLISTLENNWKLGNLNKNDVDPQLSNVFKIVASKTGYQNVDVPNPPQLK